MNDAIAPIFGTSVVRRDILAWFFTRPGAVAHPRELARRLHRPPQVVGRELARLEAAGILTSETVGRSRRYRVDEASEIAADVGSLVAKTIGVDARIRTLLTSLPGIEEAYIYGSYVRGTDRPASDIDVMIVGTLDRELLFEQLVDLERDLGRDVNVTVYARGEFDGLIRDGDLFLRDVTSGPRIELIPPDETVD